MIAREASGRPQSESRMAMAMEMLFTDAFVVSGAIARKQGDATEGSGARY